MPLIARSDKVSVLKFNVGIDGAWEVKLTQLRLLCLLSFYVVIKEWINNHFATAE